MAALSRSWRAFDAQMGPRWRCEPRCQAQHVCKGHAPKEATVPQLRKQEGVAPRAEACNTFFLFALTSVSSTVTALAPLILNTVSISTNDVHLYANFAPKIGSAQRKKMMNDEIRCMLTTLQFTPHH